MSIHVLKKYKVLAKTGGLCAYCQIPLGFVEWPGFSHARCTLDHLLPVAEGGSSELENLLPACPECNMLKGDSILEPTHPARQVIAGRPIRALKLLPFSPWEPVKLRHVPQGYWDLVELRSSLVRVIEARADCLVAVFKGHTLHIPRSHVVKIMYTPWQEALPIIQTSKGAMEPVPKKSCGQVRKTSHGPSLCFL